MRVNEPGHVINATRFAELTGVSRERLRMWERRHGFPVPRRNAGGPRRYALADVPRVLAVRRAAEDGMPIPAAIAGTRFATAPKVSAGTFEAAVDNAPLPTLLLSGPAPLRVEYLNAAAREEPAAPSPGAELDSLEALAGEPCLQRLRELFSGHRTAMKLDLPPSAIAGMARALAYRLPVRSGERPLVALAATEAGPARAARADAAAMEHELLTLRGRDERHARWLRGAEAIALAFQLDPGPTVLDQACDMLVRHLPALDAVVAASVAGHLQAPRSRRGLLEPAMVTVAGHPELARHLREAVPLPLDRAAAAALGVPDGLHALCVPILVGGETLGALVLLLDEPAELGQLERRLLTVAAAALGFALLRDRLASELRASALGPQPDWPATRRSLASA